MEKGKYFILTLVFILLILPIISSYITVTANPSSNSGLYRGDSWNSNILINNHDYSCNIRCSIMGMGNFITIFPNGQGQINLQIDAPSYGFSPNTEAFTVSCQKISPCVGYENKMITITTNYGYCGDHTKNGNEYCDRDTKSCSLIDNNYYQGNYGTCKSDCSGYNEYSCKYCGDRIINGNEQCDTYSRSCFSIDPKYYSNSDANCQSNCRYDESSCTFCGDNIKNNNEECDKGANNGNEDFPFDEETYCTRECKIEDKTQNQEESTGNIFSDLLNQNRNLIFSFPSQSNNPQINSNLETDNTTTNYVKLLFGVFLISLILIIFLLQKLSKKKKH